MIGNRRADDQSAEVVPLMRKNPVFKRGLSGDWCIYNTSHKTSAFMVTTITTDCYEKVIFSGDENESLPLLKTIFLFCETKKYFPFPLDRRILIRLFSKHATTVAASLGRSGR
ncbi:hypothetical protein D8W73_19715 [Citrobacter amalonaticus]|nr:hypothetical protein [Citrobacter amalonaticus]